MGRLMIRIEDALRSVTRLGLDTSPFIYFAEANPNYFALCEQIFVRLLGGNLFAVTSTVSLTEVLIQPIRRNNTAIQSQYMILLMQTLGLTLELLDSVTAIRAADLRARYNFKMPDALQMATAIASGCDAFLTNDVGFKRASNELPILILDEPSL